MKPLSARQQNVLDILRTLPARYRHQRRADAPIRYDVLEVYDWRTITALINRGYFRLTDYGLTYINREHDDEDQV